MCVQGLSVNEQLHAVALHTEEQQLRAFLVSCLRDLSCDQLVQGPVSHCALIGGLLRWRS